MRSQRSISPARRSSSVRSAQVLSARIARTSHASARSGSPSANSRGERARASGRHGDNHGRIDDESVLARLERPDARSGQRRPGQAALDEVRR